MEKENQLEQLEKLVKVWQTSKNIREVEARVGRPIKEIRYAVFALRKYGVPLKKMSRMAIYKENAPALIRLAKSYLNRGRVEAVKS